MDSELDISAESKRQDLFDAMKGHNEEAELMVCAAEKPNQNFQDLLVRAGLKSLSIA